MNVIEFLQARVAEDPDSPHAEAKRRILQLYFDEAERQRVSIGVGTGYHARLGALADVCQLLATGYSDHPDYDPIWSPA